MDADCTDHLSAIVRAPGALGRYVIMVTFRLCLVSLSLSRRVMSGEVDFGFGSMIGDRAKSLSAPRLLSARLGGRNRKQPAVSHRLCFQAALKSRGRLLLRPIDTALFTVYAVKNRMDIALRGVFNGPKE